jgi:hypothetical protein
MTFFKFLGPLPQTSLYLSHSRITPKWKISTLWPLLSLVLMLLPFAVPAQNPQGTPAVTSDSDLYYGIFHHVAVLKQMADTAQQQGQDRSNLRQLVRLRAGLTEAEGEALEAISVQCDSDVAAEDAKAKAIIDQFHAQYPPGVINPSFPPQAPTVLDSMWQERNNIILTARDRLRVELGEADFAKFDQFVRTQGPAPAIHPVFPSLPGAVQK